MSEGGNGENYIGLNKNGLIVFLVLLFFCFPLAWIPWLVGSLKANG